MENSTKAHAKMPKSVIVRYICVFLGIITFILGTIGIVLPILPTTPFICLQLFCGLKVRNVSRTGF